jgi:hypothetical protein
VNLDLAYQVLVFEDLNTLDGLNGCKGLVVGPSTGSR